ncbi:MAG: GNAT family N-acetyltransferase [Desulfonatronovibrionaceae bacterium]
MTAPRIKPGYLPGVIGRMAEMHINYYHPNWGFGSYFEAKVAGDLAEFIQRYDPVRDGLWSIVHRGRIEGAIAIDGIDAPSEGAHLRWFIVSRNLRGKGLGGRLLKRAVDFCMHCGYRQIYLWTFAGLDPARHLYEKAGFTLVKERTGRQWGTEVEEQRFELYI